MPTRPKCECCLRIRGSTNAGQVSVSAGAVKATIRQLEYEKRTNTTHTDLGLLVSISVRLGVQNAA